MHHPLDYTDDDFTSHRPQVSQAREDALTLAQQESGHWLPVKTDVSKLSDRRAVALRLECEARRAARLASKQLISADDVRSVYSEYAIELDEPSIAEDVIQANRYAKSEREAIDLLHKWAQQLRAEWEGDMREAAANFGAAS